MGKKYYGKSRSGLPKDGYIGAMLRMLPALFMLGLVPLVVRQYRYQTNLTQYAWFDSKQTDYEFFLASKTTLLMVLMLVMAGCILVRFWKEKRKLPFLKIFIPLFGYGVLAFLSACTSVNREFSFNGSYEQFETIWVLLSYVLIVYYVFLYANEELELQVVTDAICFSATVIGVLGTLQGVGIDYLKNGLVQKLITTEGFLNMVGGELQVTFSDGQAVATMYNPNYLGVYGSFMLPFLAMLVFNAKGTWRRIWYMADFVLVAIALLSSRSRAGFIAVGIALLIAIIICFRGLFKYWYVTIPAINFAVVLVLLVNAYNDNLLFNRLQNIFDADNVTVEREIADDGTVIYKTGLTELYTTEEGVVLTYNEIQATIVMYIEGNAYGMYALDKEGEQIELLPNENGTEYIFSHPALAGVTIAPLWIDEKLGFKIYAEHDWYFVNNEEKGNYQYITSFAKESDMIMAESIGFEEYQRIFSGRGYIWSRTIPLLKEHIFLGSGPDTFVLEFPQEDYLGMWRNGYETMIMTKPHSWYLQVGVQTGVLSLICLLVFYFWYAISCLKLYAFRKFKTQAEAFGLAAFIGSIAYMIAGISNDSMVVTAPVFWGMIGLGIAANMLVTKTRKQEKSGKEK